MNSHNELYSYRYRISQKSPEPKGGTPTYCGRYYHCKRTQSCSFCWQRYRSHLVGTYLTCHQKMAMKIAYDLSFKGCEWDKRGSLLWLATEVRPGLHKIFQKAGSPYISIISVSEEAEQSAPHFHILGRDDLVPRQAKEFLKKLAKKYGFKFDPYTQVIRTPQRIEERAGYLADRNLRFCMQIRPPRTRLVTASKGILLRPTFWS